MRALGSIENGKGMECVRSCVTLGNLHEVQAEKKYQPATPESESRQPKLLSLSNTPQLMGRECSCVSKVSATNKRKKLET